MTSRPDPSWMADGACVGADPAIWFPERGDAAALYEARAICHGCPVKAECFTEAMTPPYEFDGVWGGRSAQERKRMRAGELEPGPIEVDPRPPGSVPCRECGEWFVPVRKGHRFCHPRCKSRRSARLRYQRDAEFRALRVAEARRYYRENYDYVRAQQNLYKRAMRGTLDVVAEQGKRDENRTPVRVSNGRLGATNTSDPRAAVTAGGLADTSTEGGCRHAGR